MYNRSRKRRAYKPYLEKKLRYLEGHHPILTFRAKKLLNLLK